METEGNKEKVEQLYREGVNEGERDVGDLIREVFAPNVVVRGPVFGSGTLQGDEAIEAIEAEFARYRNGGGRLNIQEQIAEGESVATHYELSYTYRAEESTTLEDEHIESWGVTFIRFANGKIREYFVVARKVNLVEERKVAHN